MTPPVQWSAGSDPAASPWAAKSEPNAQPWQGHRPSEQSQPYPKQMLAHEPSQPLQAVVTMDVRPKRKWPLVLGALALLAIGGAVAAVAVNRGGDSDKVEQKAATEVKATTVPVEPPPKAPAVVETQTPKQPVIETPAATGSGSAEIKVEAPVVKTPVVKKTPVKTHEVVKTVPKTTQETKAPEPPQQPPVLQKPKCDPFASMHDCNNSK
jgi:hypothetical protein